MGNLPEAEFLAFHCAPVTALGRYVTGCFFWKSPIGRIRLFCRFIARRSNGFCSLLYLSIYWIFLPFITQNGWPYIKEALLLALVFPLTNAMLEEWIWRGLLLSRFSVLIGVRNALWVTSLGFSWPVCLAFALGGLFYGLITVQSKSLIPAAAWHLVINVLMVFAGLIET